MSWNLILCLLLLRIWFIFVLPLALKYSTKRQGITGGSQPISCRCKRVKGEGGRRHVRKQMKGFSNSFIHRTRSCERHVVFEKHTRITCRQVTKWLPRSYLNAGTTCTTVCVKALSFWRSSPRVTLALRARLAFVPVAWNKQKNYACSAGYTCFC